MNNLELFIRLFTTLAESFRSAVDHRTAQLDFERIKWERHEDIERTKRLLLVLQLLVLVAIFSLLLFHPWPEKISPSAERTMALPQLLQRYIQPTRPPPESPIPSVWRYSL